MTCVRRLVIPTGYFYIDTSRYKYVFYIYIFYTECNFSTSTDTSTNQVILLRFPCLKLEYIIRIDHRIKYHSMVCYVY